MSQCEERSSKLRPNCTTQCFCEQRRKIVNLKYFWQPFGKCLLSIVKAVQKKEAMICDVFLYINGYIIKKLSASLAPFILGAGKKIILMRSNHHRRPKTFTNLFFLRTNDFDVPILTLYLFSLLFTATDDNRTVMIVIVIG
jgi:hypothetical protein